jgi:hypothetical protein
MHPTRPRYEQMLARGPFHRFSPLLRLVVALLIFAAGTGGARATEFNIFPIVGGDSDVGVGFGQVSDLAKLGAVPEKYLWKVESGAFITFKPQSGSIVVPYQDYYLDLTVPELTKSQRLRLEIRPSFTNETTLKYYGVGNATPLPSPDISVEDTEYKRMHPRLATEARIRLYDQLYLFVGSIYSYSWLTVRPTSILAQQQAGGSPEVRALLGDFRPQGIEQLEAEIQYDTRDNETVTSHGQFHTANVTVSPHVGDVLRYGYEHLTVISRFYGTPLKGLTLSFRIVGDTLLGTAPFWELARFDDTPAIGGGKAVRGVPAQRYYGKVKLFENLEARHDILKGKHMVLGIAAFFDGGRSWTELGHSHPELDGTGLGLKYGVGGGLRLLQGQTFIVRADVAWSPDAQPIGAYFAAGQIF